MEGEEEEDKLLISFKSNEFLEGINKLLTLNLNVIPTKLEEIKEVKLVNRLCSILDEYQEQSYLLDPYLEQLVQPLIALYRIHIRQPNVSYTTPRLCRISHMIYFFTKVRGAKTIVRLFPHEVDDLAILLSIFNDPETLKLASWELRYILLLWLSLVSLLPFSFSSIDSKELDSNSGQLLSKIERIGQRYLGVPGKERDGAIALLSRYYSRQDSSISDFVRSCQHALSQPTASIFLSSGILQTLSEIVKIGSPAKIIAAENEFDEFLKVCDSINHIKGIGFIKARVKLSGRLTILRLNTSLDMEEEIELVIQELFEALASPDTVVRWSASKYLARIAEKLPEASSQQIVEALLEIFINEDVILDNVKVSENAWQSACLALAEFTRRGRIPDELIGDVLSSVLRALHFDKKRGVQSVGAGVRDAASYVLWSLARTIRPTQALPHANELAMHLVCAALFDREIQIRRAASAAFQESVGRWGVFPHGIDVLRTVDFLTVSVKKRAFLEAAPEVALHSEYRTALVNHLISISLVHYDSEVRTLAASSLEKIVVLDGESLIPKLVASQISVLISKDSATLHGALLSLSALAVASACLTESLQLSIKSQIFRSLSTIPLSTFSSRAYILLLPAALSVIENSCTAEVIKENDNWWSIILLACSKMDEETHQQAANAMYKVSSLADSSLSGRSLALQQSSALILGTIDYTNLNSSRLIIVLNRLIEFSGVKSDTVAGSIEGKRNGIIALSKIISSSESQKQIPMDLLLAAFYTILNGFEDYTVDQRGDVGSWVRLASVGALKNLFSTECYFWRLKELPKSSVEKAWASLLKQSVERLDKLREAAGNVIQLCQNNFKSILSVDISTSPFDLLPDINEQGEWRDIQWVSERILPFLALEPYRMILLEGALLGITIHSSSSPFFDLTMTLPIQSSTEFSLHQLLKDICHLANEKFSTNRIFVPSLHALSIVTEVGMQQSDTFDLEIIQSILLLSTKAISKIKNSPRLNASLKLLINLLQLSPTSYSTTVPKIKLFLSHPLPWTAEALFDHGFGSENEELESLLLETNWSEEEFTESANRVTEILLTIE